MRYLAVLTTIFLMSCSNGHHLNKPVRSSSADSSKSNVKARTQPNKVSIFAIIHEGKTIALKDREQQINLDQTLGRPQSVETRVLGEGADTHQGSIIKMLGYNGLVLQLFSPLNNEFWILSIEIKSPDYVTSKGIAIGNSLKQIKESYPGIEIAADGRTDPADCAYVFNRDDNYLRIEVKNAIAQSIRIYHEIP